ncbi:hypothetical protein D3C80_1491570 [compost metagenome]
MPGRHKKYSSKAFAEPGDGPLNPACQLYAYKFINFYSLKEYKPDSFFIWPAPGLPRRPPPGGHSPSACRVAMHCCPGCCRPGWPCSGGWPAGMAGCPRRFSPHPRWSGRARWSWRAATCGSTCRSACSGSVSACSPACSAVPCWAPGWVPARGPNGWCSPPSRRWRRFLPWRGFRCSCCCSASARRSSWWCCSRP